VSVPAQVRATTLAVALASLGVGCGGSEASFASSTTGTVGPGGSSGEGGQGEGGGGAQGGAGPGGGTSTGGSGGGDGACADVYAQELLPTFDVDIAPEAWSALADEFVNWQSYEANGLPLKQYQPTVFRYEGEVFEDAHIRLKGNPCCSWSGEKMQFVISFNEIDKKKRFHGLRKIALDAPPYDPSLLRERLSYSVYRDLGLPGSCANSARLVVNGALYGVYTNVEHPDKEYLQRSFGKEGAKGPLYKYGSEPKVNEDKVDLGRLEAFWNAASLGDLAALSDLEQVLASWAVEAVLPDVDGYWAGSGNFYVYDHPTRGFLHLPWDLDYTFEGGSPDLDPVAYIVDWGTRPPLFDMVTKDPAGLELFRQAIAKVRGAYEPSTLVARLDAWSAQIGPHIEAEPNKPFSYGEHLAAVEALRAFPAARAAFVDGWLAK
jgi:hypothetical protein